MLCVAGGGAYYFAKKSINADKQLRFEEEMKKKSRMARLESSAFARESAASSKKKKITSSDSENSSYNARGLDHVGSPSSEISEDAAPVGHAPVDDNQKIRERSKYEAAEPYRSKKGDRFS